MRIKLLPFSAVSRAICVERDVESDAYLHEEVVVEQFKLLQPLFSTNLKQALISELVGSLVKEIDAPTKNGSTAYQYSTVLVKVQLATCRRTLLVPNY